MSRGRHHPENDRCPGALQVHQAADGALARIRLPGGVITPEQLETLAHAATSFGSAALELTSRGNIQIRAVDDPAALADAVAAAGLLPSPTRERVRNIVASPLSGRLGGLADVRDLVRALDAEIQHDPGLAELPGRFWFGIDDGRGDVSGLGTDVGAHVLGPDHAALLVAGTDTGVRIELADVVPSLVGVARRFAEIRENAWRTVELDDVTPLLAGFTAADEPGRTWQAVLRPPVGWIDQDDGRIALGAAVPLGLLDARAAEFLAAIDAPLVITPWRSVLVCDLDEGVADVSLRVLAPQGLVFDASSPWLEVSSCTGSPGCAKSAADVRQDAAEAAKLAASSPPSLHSPGSGMHRHFVGCDRACGSPPGSQVLVATPDGYETRHP